MTALKTTITLDDTCGLTVTDISGYYDVDSNATGFLLESNTDDVTFGVYKLSYGYFINVILYNKYNSEPIITNTTEDFFAVAQPSNATYANNFTPTKYTLTKDGSYTIKRFFVISDDFYTAHADDGIFDEKIVYYTDGTSIYKVTDSVPTQITFSAFLDASFTTATVLEIDSILISTCILNSCYYKLMNVILDFNLNSCDQKYFTQYVKDRDLVYMTLEIIKYLQESNNITQIQKVIEAIEGCCSVCSSKVLGIPVASGGCGCG